MRLLRISVLLALIGYGSLSLTGCGSSVPSAKNPAAAVSESKSTESERMPDEKPKRRGPVELGDGSAAKVAVVDDKAVTESIVAALQPLQILLGKWNGSSRKAVIDQPEWKWDFRSDKRRPALVLTSDQGGYLRKAQLTYLPDKEQYQLTAVDAEDQERVYRGTFTEPVHDVTGDNDQPQRTYKLTLTEVNSAMQGEVWQIAFAQQENDRYIVEVSRQRGSGAFTRIDTIHTQREGTSFAVSSTDYGEKTCVISQGLGTISISYLGKSYWVCCTGCQAAFEEDPERWIARFEEMKKMKR